MRDFARQILEARRAGEAAARLPDGDPGEGLGLRQRLRARALSRRQDPLTRLTRLLLFALLVLGKAHRDAVLLTSSALAYVTILSFIPLLAAFSFVGTRVFQEYQDRVLDLLVQVLPYHEDTITQQIQEFLLQAETLRGWGLLAFFASSLFVFGTVEGSMNVIWKVPEKRPFKSRFLSFTLMVFWGPLLLGTVFSGLIVMGRRPGWERVLEGSLFLQLLPFLLTLLTLAVLYWMVPMTAVRFDRALVGALAASLVLEGLRHGFGSYVSFLSNVSLVYGSFAFALFFAISIQLSWATVLYGCEVAYCAQHFTTLVRDMDHDPPLLGRWIALATVVTLADRFEDGTPTIERDELAARLQVAADELEAILQPLQDARILTSPDTRERAYQLARPPHKLTAETVLAAYDADTHRVFQPLSRPLRETLSQLVRDLEAERRQGFGSATLTDLVARTRNGPGNGPGDTSTSSHPPRETAPTKGD